MTKILVLNSLDRLSLDLEDKNLLLTIRVGELTRSTRKGITRTAPTDLSTRCALPMVLALLAPAQPHKFSH